MRAPHFLLASGPAKPSAGTICPLTNPIHATADTDRGTYYTIYHTILTSHILISLHRYKMNSEVKYNFYDLLKCNFMTASIQSLYILRQTSTYSSGS